MVFQQPVFLYGLFLLTIPILIHFLNFRKSKTQYFSSLRFIEEVKSTYRKRNRLTDLLLLILRLFIMACLIISFAQPTIQTRRQGTAPVSNLTGLFIDNSQSMELAEQGESLLSKAKSRAKEIVSEFPPDSRFILLYSGPSADLPGITDKELTLKAIDGIQQSADQLSMDDILLFFSQGSSDRETSLSSVILISDFQESLFSKAIKSASSDATVFLAGIRPAATSNISVDTCWLDNPLTLAGQNNQIIARINNRSDQDYEAFPVRLVINDTLRNETSAKLPARTLTEVPLSFHTNSSGWQTGSVQVSDFPVVFDNQLLFSFKIESDIPVLLIHGKSENLFIRSVFGNDPYFKFESYGDRGFPRSDFKDYNLVIISGINSIERGIASKALDFMKNGGTVWFLPELPGDVANYNDFLRLAGIPDLQGIITYRTDSRIASGQNQWLQEVVVNVDKRLRLPFFNQSYRIPASSLNRTDILNSVTGDLLLGRFRVGNGSLVLAGFPLEDNLTDLMYHPLFVPLCYRIATMSTRSQALYQVNGMNRPYIVGTANSTSSKPIRLLNTKTGFETVPVQHLGTAAETILYPGNMPASGIYSALAGADTLSKVAINTSRVESAMVYLADSIIAKRLKSAGWNISMNNNSLSKENPYGPASESSAKKIWYYFLFMALIGLLAESFAMNAKK